MKMSNLIKDLQERELFAQVTDQQSLEKKLNQKPIVLYCGFDPTSDSLHLGHLIPLLCLRRFQQAGHKPIVLIGGATGLIGDPSLKTKERKLSLDKKVHCFTDKIRKQISLFLDFDCGINSAITMNNYDWFKTMSLLTFLQDIGRHFSINQMMQKKSVKQRIHCGSRGISFTEFSYSLLQSYDFAYLNQMYGVTLQVGGSDQWSNIVSGVDLIRRMYHKQVFGLTLPLFIKSDGKKFGKTELNTIWLDPKKTSPYKFYQFWINTLDTEVYRFLKFFTFISIKEINYLEQQDQNYKQILLAKHMLAEHITLLVHKQDGLSEAKRISKKLFNNIPNNLSEIEFQQLIDDGIPMIEIDKGTDLVKALVDSKFQPSRGQAKKTISANAVTINGKKQTDPHYVISEVDRLFGRYTLLGHGKKNYCLLYWK